jgi:three-Cys-motif partner protein
MKLDEHEFGGQHTELKLALIRGYLSAFTTALNDKPFSLWYFDAFAGTGRRTVRVEARGGDLFEQPAPERIEQRKGSAQIALETDPPFDRLVFMDNKPRHCEALRRIRANHPERRIDVFDGDANEIIQKEMMQRDWRSVRAVMFLDPYGMEVEWKTLEAIANTRAVDVWYLFPLSGLYRQATKKHAKIDPDKRAALNRMLGSGEWEDHLYSKSPQSGLFDSDGDLERTANVRELEEYVRGRLKQIFAQVLPPLQLPIRSRPQRFSLFFAISNPAPLAVRLASKIASHILKVGSSSQV